MSQAILQMRRRTPPQKRISESQKRFNIAAWGRQSGKTTFGLDKMTYRPLQGRAGGIYWYVLQTNSAAEVAFNRHWQMLFDSGLLYKKPNESEKSITLLNKSIVHYKSGDVFQNLRAETLDGCIIDEVRQQQAELWPMVIRPMLSRYQAWCDFYSTPNGFDHFYDLWNFALDHPDEWGGFHAPSTECPWWSEAEVASAKATMSEAEFAQEILAEFRDLHVGKAYINFSRENLHPSNPFAGGNELLSPYLPIVVGLDFNVNPMAWELGQNRGPDWYWHDEIFVRNTNTQACAKELVARVKGHKPGVLLAGDATGNSRKTSASQSDYTIIIEALNSAGIHWENQTPESNPAVRDRVNTVNAKLKAADGRIHMWVHPERCPMLKRDLERVSWKQGAQSLLDQTTNSELTHASDAIGYPVCALNPLTQTGSVGVMRILR